MKIEVTFKTPDALQNEICDDCFLWITDQYGLKGICQITKEETNFQNSCDEFENKHIANKVW